MDGLPVTIRLLDPPLHEFMPQEEKLIKELAKSMGKKVHQVKARIDQLHELRFIHAAILLLAPTRDQPGSSSRVCRSAQSKPARIAPNRASTGSRVSG